MQGGELSWPKARAVGATITQGDHESGRFLIVTWDGGGNAPPALGLGRRLIARGHSVRVLAHRTLRERIEAARCAFRPFPAALEWDPAKGRAFEDQREAFRAILVGLPLAETVLAEVRREPADVLIVDCMLRSALCAAKCARLPTVALVHMRYRNFAEVRDPMAWEWDFEPVNETRQRLGLKPVPRQDERLIIRLWRCCDRLLVVMPREFEDFDGPLLQNARYVGPVFEGDEEEAPWDLPWPPDHPHPLVVVSFSSTYMHHEVVLGRVLAALEPLSVRAVVTLGGGLEPNEVSAPSDVVVRRYVPHAIVLPHASMVVTHAGMGTIMAAFAHGVPMLCMPLGRDQSENAQKVEALAAGRTISPEASVEEVRAAIVDVIGSDVLRTGARRMAEIIAGYGGGNQAIDELESLITSYRAA